MKVLELIALSKEKIDELKIETHQLWIVRIDAKIYGPYEGKTLKAYAEKNQDLFNEAESTRIDTQDWQPFFSHALFQRRNPQIIKNEPKNFNGPYWVLHEGIKTGPIDKKEIVKSLELGTLTITDLISIDDGHHWMKVFEIPELDRRYFSIDDLPASPEDSDFNEARVKILEKIENENFISKISDELAELTYQAEKSENIISFNTESIPVERTQVPLIDKDLKIKLAFLVGSFIGLVFIFQLLFQDPQDTIVAEEQNLDSNETFSTNFKSLPIKRKNYDTSYESLKVRRPASLPKLAPITPESHPADQGPIYRDDLEVEQNQPAEEPHHQEITQHHETPQENGEVAASENTDEATPSEARTPATQSEENLVTPVQPKTLDDVVNGPDNYEQESIDM